MRKIKAILDIGFPGACRDDIIEIDDDMTEDEINQMIWDHMTQFVDVYIDEDWNEDDE